MSADLKTYAPIITRKLDFATIDVYLLKYEILTLSEHEGFHKALQSGTVTNSGLVRQLLPKLLGKPVEFYQALHEYVNSENQEVHPGNKELFQQLLESFNFQELENTTQQLESSITEENRKLENLVKESITDLQQQMSTLSSSIFCTLDKKNKEHELTVKKLQCDMAQRNKEYELRLQCDMAQMRDEIMDQIKSQIKTEKETTSKTQEAAKQVSIEKEKRSVKLLILEEGSQTLKEEKQLENISEQFTIDKKEQETHIKDGQNKTKLELKLKEEQVVLEQVSAETKEKVETSAKDNFTKTLVKDELTENLNMAAETSTTSATEKSLPQIVNYENSDIQEQFNNVFKVIDKIKTAVSRQSTITKKYYNHTKDTKELSSESSLLEERFTHIKEQVNTNKEAMDNLQKHVTKMQSEIEQSKSVYNYNDVKTSSISVPIEAEQEENGKANETLTEISAEKNKSKDDSKTTVYRKETQSYTEKEDMTNAHKTLFQEKILASHQILLQEKSNTEKQLRDGLEQSQVDNELHIKELKDNNTSLQTKLENANELLLQANKNIMEFEHKNTLLLDKQNNLETIIKELQDENNMLKAANKKYDTQLWEHKKKLEQKDTAQLQKVNSKPTKKKLLDHVVARVTPLWHDLGITLFNEDQELNLDIIKSNYTDKKTCCKEMFWHWLSTDTSASWQKLIQALRSPSVELFVVADDLEKMLTDQSSAVDSEKDDKMASSSKIFEKKPQIWQLKRYVIPKIMDHWEDVALHSLCYDDSMVTMIKINCASDPERCCNELFKDWVSTENGISPKIWEMLLMQLKEVKELAPKVEEITKMLILKK